MDITTDNINQIADLAEKLLDGVTSVADVKGISPEELEALYQVGYGLYTSGRFADAEKVFYFVCVLSHTNTKFWTALGAVRQAQANYKDAIIAYAAGAMYDLHQPKPHYYSAECNIALGDLEAAESGCNSLLGLCPAGTPVNDKYRAMAEQLLKKIELLRKA